VVLTGNVLDQYSDDTGAHFVAFNVHSISAGRQGFSSYVNLGGEGYLFSQSGGWTQDLGAGLSEVTAGTDANGYWLIDELFSNSTLQELGFNTAKHTVASGVISIDKARLGAEDVVLQTQPTSFAATPSVVGVATGGVVNSSPAAWEYTPNGRRYLSGNAAEAV
jgi:hypothetical protein